MFHASGEIAVVAQLDTIFRRAVSIMSAKTPNRLTTPGRSRSHAIGGSNHLIGARRGAASHQEILLSTLRLNSVLPFSLFTKIEGEYLMYRKQDLPFTGTQHNALRSSGVDRLYVAGHDLDSYWEYLRGNIRSTLVEGTLSTAERSTAFYDSTAALAEQIFALPITKDAFGTAAVLVSESVKLQGEGKHMLHALMQQMKSEPSLYHRSLDNCIYGLALGQAVGLQRQDLESLGLGLFFMDIGMLHVPAQVVDKQAEFSGQERDQVRQHPVLGVTALSALSGVQEITRNVIYGHHERIDGSGYPQGCHGNEVRLESRIAGIVDTFAALTSARPHRPAYTTYEALTVMQKTLCSTFDLDLLRVLIRLLGR
ncbi:MAG: HD-GYP domain-containing protein [Planctomycetota bacterium]